MKSLGLIVLFGIYSFFASNYYVCHIKQVCGSKQEKVQVETPPATQNYPIAFNWSDPTPIQHNTDSLLQAVSSDIAEGQVIQINGHYFYDEENNTDYDDLGQARAEEVKNLLAELVDPQKIRVISSPENGTAEEFDGEFESVTFEVIDLDISKAEVIDMGNKKVILFPHGAKDKQPDPIIDGFLDGLAQSLIKSGNTVEITGYTDNVGSSKRNKELGLRRAKNIRDYLRKKGVSRKQIKTFSMGEEHPVATNDSSAGRHQNRRVEIVIK